MSTRSTCSSLRVPESIPLTAQGCWEGGAREEECVPGCGTHGWQARAAPGKLRGVP